MRCARCNTAHVVTQLLRLTCEGVGWTYAKHSLRGSISLLQNIGIVPDKRQCYLRNDLYAANLRRTADLTVKFDRNFLKVSPLKHRPILTCVNGVVCAALADSACAK
jgi:hypothetical protein